jgi:serine/threonine-protein kinase
MGAVFEAVHTTIGRRFAIKVIHRELAGDEDVVLRFEREARAATAIESDHIVSVVDFGKDDGRPYIVMELLRGEDLGSRLARQRTIGLGEAVHVVAQVLRGLVRAHSAGIVHRDLKPDNVIITSREDDPTFAKLVDFGISKIGRLGDRPPLAITQAGVVLGTPLFMSPEQAEARPDIDARSDLYSVGAILFECLSGRPPHVGESEEEILARIRTGDAPDLRMVAPGTPAPVAAFVARALARDRAARFQTASEMLAALRAIAPGEPAATPPKAVGTRELDLAKSIIDGRAAVGRERVLPVVVAAIAACLVGVGLAILAETGAWTRIVLAWRHAGH